MTTTSKITAACFTGAAVGTAVALLLAPWLVWLGALAGFAAGYLAYEFRSVIAAVPRACKKASEEDLRNVKDWFKAPKPLAIPALAAFVFWLYLFFTYGTQPNGFFVGFLAGVGGAVSGLLVSLITAVITYKLMGFGCSKHPMLRRWIKTDPGCFMLETDHDSSDNSFTVIVKERVYAGSRSDEGLYYCINHPAGYREPFLLALRGLVILAYEAARLLFWRLPKALFLTAWWTFKYVHCNERLLCGVDSAIGTMAAAALFRSSDMGWAAFTFAVLCGGLLGAAIGALNYRVISVRLLRLARAGE